jgi:hypothetical protein
VQSNPLAALRERLSPVALRMPNVAGTTRWAMTLADSK